MNEKLEKALEAGEKAASETVAGTSLQVEDVMNRAKKLSELARNAMSLRSSSMTIVEDDGKVYTTIFLASTVNLEVPGALQEGIDEVSEKLNTLAASGKLYAALSPLCYLELAKVPLHARKGVVLAYVLVPAQDQDNLKDALGGLNVAELPPSRGPVMPVLEEDEFLADISVGAWGRSREQIEELFSEELAVLTKLLPEETFLVEAKECAVTNLSLRREYRFRNPRKLPFKAVRLEWSRAASVRNDKVVEYNLFRGITYLDENLKEIRL